MDVEIEGTCPDQSDILGATQEAMEGDASRVESRVEFSIPAHSSVPLAWVGELAKTDLSTLLLSMETALQSMYTIGDVEQTGTRMPNHRTVKQKSTP